MLRKALPPILLVSALILWATGCGGPQEKDAINEITGTWQTDAAKYAGCSMKIEPHWLTIKNAEGGGSTSRITGLNVTRMELTTLYEINYEDTDGVEYMLGVILYHKRRPDAVLRLKNQPGILWARQASADS